MDTKETHFKIGVSFTGTHRDYVRQIVTALVDESACKDDIFFDEWHEALINGPSADIKIADILSNSCDCIVVFFSQDYNITPSITQNAREITAGRCLNSI